ncbi:acetyl-CoA carboxylase biotin carboxylase subunit family protein [Streptomyces sp. NPDC051569]|uniref:acetyl-CoA carboxylase biotin carboxylase subunit family protein n=1 Tax=Streptomyces sp. NPDC051569 TaxID=3365661 RepID=UPI00378DE708
MDSATTDSTNIFVMGLDDLNKEMLLRAPGAEGFRFHSLLTIEELQSGDIDIPALLARAERRLDDFDGTIDAIVGYWDFPVSSLVPILCERYGVRGTSLESIVKCEHKYWSRIEQRKVISELPGFGIVDLEGTPDVPDGLRFPLWLKPVKSFSSDLAFGVNDKEEFDRAVEEIRAGIGRIGGPFEDVLAHLDVPAEIADVGGRACLAEEALAGVQVAVEGYVFNGDVTVYGALDSITYPDSACFLRHQYPAGLPDGVVRRLEDVSERVIRQLGLDSVTFSIEFFYDPETGEINVLEINPRHSQSHAEMFEYVDGVQNHHAMLSLALGRDPHMPKGKGEYEVGAKWYYRRFTDGVVRRVPTRQEIDELQDKIPGVKIDVIPQEGRLLSEMLDQDSYSYELAHVFIGAHSEEELCAKYERCVASLNFEITDSPTEGDDAR